MTKSVMGISCLHFAWNTLDEAFGRCADEFGLELLELSTGKVTPDQFAQVRRLRSKSGLTLGLHAWDDLPKLGLVDGVRAAKELLETCKAMEVKYLILHLGTAPDRKQGLVTMRQIVEAIAPMYDEAGVHLCLENHYAYEYRGLNELGGEPSDFHAIFSPSLPKTTGFLLDYGHSNMTGNHHDFLDELGDRLLYTHIADNMGEHDDHLAWGQGTVDWNDVISYTAARGFTGPYVIEFPEHRGREYIDQCIAEVRRIVAEASEAPAK